MTQSCTVQERRRRTLATTLQMVSHQRTVRTIPEIVLEIVGQVPREREPAFEVVSIGQVGEEGDEAQEGVVGEEVDDPDKRGTSRFRLPGNGTCGTKAEVSRVHTVSVQYSKSTTTAKKQPAKMAISS